MKDRRNMGSKAATLCVLAALTVSIGGGVAGFAASTNHAPAVVSEQTIVKNLSVLENRFFSRQYANDPTEKRLERLELLVYGGTQGGSNEERYNHLQSSLLDRARESAAKVHVADSKKGTVTKDTAAQYPILNTLEWRALKKTFPNEPIDARLGRMEKQLFGSENQTMALADRVDRLKKTLGVDVVAAKPTGPLGPAPKARPRGQDGSDGYFGYTAPPMFDDGSGENPLFSMGVPGLGMGVPGGFGFGLTGTMNKMFEDMNRQMSQMNKLGPGVWVYDQGKGAWIDQNSGRVVKPTDPKQPWSLPDTPGRQAPSTAPKRQSITAPRAVPQVPQFPMFQQQKKDLDFPPYADPNSI